jgi:hypothetical protein
MPFEHEAFPKVSIASMQHELLRLFPLASDPRYEHVPTALVIFDDVAAFDAPLAPFVEDERVDLALSRIEGDQAQRAIDLAVEKDRVTYAAFHARFGSQRFTQQSLEGALAYLTLWGQSALISRRRVYRGFKSMVAISAYSQVPFWNAVGYEGPLLPRSD